MTSAKFRAAALEAGFTSEQAEFLIDHVSHPGHHHTAAQIDDLTDAVNDIVEGDTDEEDDEEDEEEPRQYLEDMQD